MLRSLRRTVIQALYRPAATATQPCC